MILASMPENETERLADLRALQILDTPAEERFDRITRLATKVFDLPIAYVALVDANRQWFKSKQGVCADETGRDISFCAHTILNDDPLIIPDARQDNRFADNPMVTGDPHVVFYAGHPLKGPGGQNVGTLCVVDHEPRDFDDDDREIFAELAQMAERELNMVEVIGSQRDLLAMKNELVASRQALAEELNEAADYVRSLLPMPMLGPVKIDWRFQASSKLGGDAFGYHWLDDHRLAVYLLDVTGHGVGSALLSISVMNMIRSASIPDPCQPDQVLKALNRAFPMYEHSNKFFTMWYGVLDTRDHTLTYAGGGHPPALRIRPNGSDRHDLHPLDSSGLVVGVDPDASYHVDQTRLNPGDRIYLYSDGVFEVFNPDGDILALDGFTDIVQSLPHDESATPHLDRILMSIKDWQGHEDGFVDDISLVELTVEENVE